MRKFQKEQLLDIFTSLHELHRECKDKMEQKEYQTVQIALSDCQEAAIQTGEAIEQLMGEGTEAVTFLEQYCERLYNFSIQLEELSAQKFYKSLEEVLIKAENAVKHMSTRKEVVFFPYKASMWDSLESVYLAAKEDKNCDAYCVPIPYYDRRADGSLSTMHYEGNEYPKNIEVIDYRTYNLEERHPDTIYIHNPYDEWNHVTCVPERYFAKNLRNYTDELVYIPYFVLKEIEPNDQNAIDGIKHFCFTPGVIYSHKVIVQSEKMRQIYINEYIKAAKESGLSGEHTDRKYLEQKILGLGSPKLDKVLNTKKEDLDIPEDWLKIIEKTDGSWKKVILYNTGLTALLQHGEQMIKKIKDSLKTFKENKDAVTLLWRPHPLIKATIEAMRPQLWREYNQIVEEYCSEGWGIYDDSAELDRAVVLSDKYYGDMSSVVQLYEKCNKPVLIQDVNMLCNHEKRINSQIEAGVVIDNMIYYTIPRYNKFYCTDLRNGKTQCINNSIGRRKEATDRFNHATIIEDNIFFLSDENYECAILNLRTKEIKEVHLSINKDEKAKYLGKYNGDIYFIGCNADSLYVVNYDEVNEYKIEEESISATEGIFWFIEREECTLWKIDVVNKTKERHAYIAKKFLIKDADNYSFVIEKDNKLIFVPNLVEEMLVYDLSNESIQRIKLPRITTYVLGGVGAFRYIEGTNERVFLSSMFSSEIYMWENEGLMEVGRMGIGMDDISFNELCDDLFKNNLVIELYMDLSVYINV